MNKHISRSVFRLDEAEPLHGVEPGNHQVELIKVRNPGVFRIC